MYVPIYTFYDLNNIVTRIVIILYRIKHDYNVVLQTLYYIILISYSERCFKNIFIIFQNTTLAQLHIIGMYVTEKKIISYNIYNIVKKLKINIWKNYCLFLQY